METPSFKKGINSYAMSLFFKVIWIILTLVTIVILFWNTILFSTIGNLKTENYNFWNLVLPNLISLFLLLKYSKDVLSGYQPTSNRLNLIWLVILAILVPFQIWVQQPQFDVTPYNFDLTYWPIIVAQGVILTSYIGLILNRVLWLKIANS